MNKYQRKLVDVSENKQSIMLELTVPKDTEKTEYYESVVVLSLQDYDKLIKATNGTLKVTTSKDILEGITYTVMFRELNFG